MTDEVNAFYGGMVAGIKLYQKKVVLAHKSHEPIRIDGCAYCRKIFCVIEWR